VIHTVPLEVEHMRVSFVPTLVLSLCLAICGVAVAGGLSDEDLAVIEASTQAFETAMAANDMKGVAATYTEDAVLLPPNSPRVEGRAAIQAYFEGFPPLTSFELEDVEIDGTGEFAYVVGVYTMALDMGGEEPVADTGKYMEIRKKQTDGSWLLYRDMFSSDLPVPAE